MGERSDRPATRTKHETKAERASDREIVVRRTFDAPARIVFEAWTKPEHFARWWIPKSMGMTLLSCEMDVRVGGSYRLVIRHGDAEPMAFFGTYVDVVPGARIVWTNDEGGPAGPVTTVTFTEEGERTLVVMRELYPSKEALDAGAGATDAMVETFAQLDALLADMEVGEGG